MSNRRAIFSFCIFSLFYIHGLTAQDEQDEIMIKACIQNLFKGMLAGDTNRVLATFHEDVRMQTTNIDSLGVPQVVTGTVAAFLNRVQNADPNKLDERILRYDIKVDGLMASAWTEYSFYLDGQLHHCGTNAFQLFKTNQGWKITQVVDTRYYENCVEVSAELAEDQMNYQHPISFQPENYLCYHAENPITIDGRIEETDWVSAPWTNDFVDIEGDLKPRPTHRTRAKMLWDDEYFYFAAVLEEPHLWATLTQRDTIIFMDDDFEIFIDPDGDGHNYYEFEMNANNTVWDLLMLWPYHLGRGPNNVFNWNNPGLKTAVHIEGTLNNPSDEDSYWSLEVAFPWSALRELANKRAIPKAGDQWRVNFSRVDWHMNIVNGQYVKQKDANTKKELPPENWLWSPTGRIDMHRPETWGFVQFSDNPASNPTDQFHPKPEEELKWVLWQLFYQQMAFYKKYGWYSADVTHFSIPEVEGQNFSTQFYAGVKTFEITLKASNGMLWHIDHTGRVWRN